MPEPEWANLEYDPMERPHVGVEIIGRGASTRKSKTFLKDLEIASLLGYIRGYCDLLEEQFRRLHEMEFGTRLSVRELREHYPVILEWERLHQEQVDHYASIEGFSVKSVAGQRDEPSEKRPDSSAGTDARKNGDEKWR